MAFVNGYSNCRRLPGDKGCVHHALGSPECEANKTLFEGDTYSRSHDSVMNATRCWSDVVTLHAQRAQTLVHTEHHI